MLPAKASCRSGRRRARSHRRAGPGAVDVDLKVGALKACWMRASATPGTWRSLRVLVGIGAVGAIFEPMTCTSIGAGEPKLRIWLTMSAGRNEKVVPGNGAATVRAGSSHNSGASASRPSFEVIRMSPSKAPMFRVG